MFQELLAPTQDASGYWIAQGKDSSGMHYLLNDRIEIAHLMHNAPNDFFFEKESECHTAAAAYYSLFGGRVAYPYTLEWSMAILREQDAAGIDITVINTESETMEFIWKYLKL